MKVQLDGEGNKTNVVKLEGGDPNAPVLVSNVDEGKSDNDAVNVKQQAALRDCLTKRHGM